MYALLWHNYDFKMLLLNTLDALHRIYNVHMESLEYQWNSRRKDTATPSIKLTRKQYIFLSVGFLITCRHTKEKKKCVNHDKIHFIMLSTRNMKFMIALSLMHWFIFWLFAKSGWNLHCSYWICLFFFVFRTF